MLKRALSILLAAVLLLSICLSGFTVSAYTATENTVWQQFSKEEKAEIFELWAQYDYEKLQNMPIPEGISKSLQERYEKLKNRTYEEYKATLTTFEEYLYVGAYPVENGYILDLHPDYIEGVDQYFQVGDYKINRYGYTTVGYSTMYLYADGELTPLDPADFSVEILDQIYAVDHRDWLKKVGDFDGDEKIDVSDIMRLKTQIMRDAFSPDVVTLFDIDGSETIDVGDVLKLKSMILSA